MDEEDVEEEDDDDVLLTKFGGPEPRSAPMDKTALSFVYNLSKREENKKDEGTRRRVVEVQKFLPVSTTTAPSTTDSTVPTSPPLGPKTFMPTSAFTTGAASCAKAGVAARSAVPVKRVRNFFIFYSLNFKKMALIRQSFLGKKPWPNLLR